MKGTARTDGKSDHKEKEPARKEGQGDHKVREPARTGDQGDHKEKVTARSYVSTYQLDELIFKLDIYVNSIMVQ